MSLSSRILPELRRARAHLGTLVEIAIPSVPSAEEALANAFAAIARTHVLMSAHDPTSDLGRMQAACLKTEIRVDGWTWRVLAAALRIARLTHGAFDPVSAGHSAVARGDLPPWPGRPPSPQADYRDVVLLSGNRVRLAKNLRLDLGGIAKGFAVDQAVRVLRRRGIPWGLVNAGGDIRAFGARTWAIHLRRPGTPGQFVRQSLRNGALATSAPYFSERMHGGRATSALRDPLTDRFITGAISISVFAQTCLAADALTKVVLTASAAEALCRMRARALIIQENSVCFHAT